MAGETPLPAEVVSVGPRDPYPTGSAPDNSLVPGRVHLPAQLLTDGPAGYPGSPWVLQQQQNLAAGGMIAGGAAYTP